MFGHIFLNRMKCALRNKEMIFWTLLFPILLATLFKLAFSNLSSIEKFEPINIAVIDNEEYRKDTLFQAALMAVSNNTEESSKRPLFNVTLTTQEEGELLLKNNKITGYILFNQQKPQLVVKDSGIYETIVKEFLDQYLQTSSAVTTIMSQNQETLPVFEVNNFKQNNYLREVALTQQEPNTILSYYYALIAMACLYGGFWGLKEVSAIQANQSHQGARVSLAPVHKLKVFGCSICAVTLIHFCSILILIAYLGLVLKIDFGHQLGYVLMASAVACLTGVSIGALIGAVVKKGENIRTAVLIAVTMTLSFLSGLMVVDMKYLVAKHMPIMAYVNPANLITDAFYSLYFYDSHTRFFVNIGLLSLFSAMSSLLVYALLRRQKYASI